MRCYSCLRSSRERTEAPESQNPELISPPAPETFPAPALSDPPAPGGLSSGSHPTLDTRCSWAWRCPTCPALPQVPFPSPPHHPPRPGPALRAAAPAKLLSRELRHRRYRGAPAHTEQRMRGFSGGCAVSPQAASTPARGAPPPPARYLRLLGVPTGRKDKVRGGAGGRKSPHQPQPDAPAAAGDEHRAAARLGHAGLGLVKLGTA